MTTLALGYQKDISLSLVSGHLALFLFYLLVVWLFMVHFSTFRGLCIMKQFVQFYKKDFFISIGLFYITAILCFI